MRSLRKCAKAKASLVVEVPMVANTSRRRPARSGVCRICGCTGQRACLVDRLRVWAAARGDSPGPCAWVDENHTFCSAHTLPALRKAGFKGGRMKGPYLMVGAGKAARAVLLIPPRFVRHHVSILLKRSREPLPVFEARQRGGMAGPEMVGPGDYGPVRVVAGEFRDYVGYYDDDESGSAYVILAGGGGDEILVPRRYLRKATEAEVEELAEDGPSTLAELFAAVAATAGGQALRGPREVEVNSVEPAIYAVLRLVLGGKVEPVARPVFAGFMDGREGLPPTRAGFVDLVLMMVEPARVGGPSFLFDQACAVLEVPVSAAGVVEAPESFPAWRQRALTTAEEAAMNLGLRLPALAEFLNEGLANLMGPRGTEARASWVGAGRQTH